MNNEIVQISKIDIDHLRIIRNSVRNFTKRCADQYVKKDGGIVLDVAPQVHEGARPFIPAKIGVETLDIDPISGATYIGDLCELSGVLEDRSFDYIFCTEVLEHVLQPFNAVSEIYRLLTDEGMLFLTVPFNFRIHGPLPDCWRFTEHGLRALLKNFHILELSSIDTPGRALMPIHYCVIARKCGV